MKKILAIVGGVLGVAVVGLLGAASMQPDVSHVERSIVLAATPQDAFPYINNFDNWQRWNPWAEMDPTEKVTFSENRSGKDAWTEWDGNDDVGAGRMTIVNSVENEFVEEDLHFTRPFEAHTQVKLALTAEGENTKLTWTYDGKNDLMGKVMCLFMDMDKMLGGDFDRGLAKLKPLVEADAAKRKQAEADAAAAAATPVDPDAAVDPNAAPPTP